MKLLFVNACPRGREVSRTLELCDAFMETFREKNPGVLVEELDLFRAGVHCYGMEEIQRRDELIAQDCLSDEMFDLAHGFASADMILVGAPYWDLSFPAMLKAYVENVCVNNITFRYTADGPEGISSFSKMIYLTSCGGYPGDKRFGEAYMEGIAHFLGKGEYASFCAEGLDIQGNDVRAIMEEAKRKVRELV